MGYLCEDWCLSYKCSYCASQRSFYHYSFLTNAHTSLPQPPTLSLPFLTVPMLPIPHFLKTVCNRKSVITCNMRNYTVTPINYHSVHKFRCENHHGIWYMSYEELYLVIIISSFECASVNDNMSGKRINDTNIHPHCFMDGAKPLLKSFMCVYIIDFLHTNCKLHLPEISSVVDVFGRCVNWCTYWKLLQGCVDGLLCAVKEYLRTMGKVEIAFLVSQNMDGEDYTVIHVIVLLFRSS